MRITGGAARSIVLKTADVEILRPDTDAMRVALFNSLGEVVVGSVFYDLFAGCGATGLEAFSRGAAREIFVERHRKLTGVIKQNIITVAQSARREGSDCQLYQADVFAHPYPVASADIIFCDPPYAIVADSWPKLGLIATTALKPGGLFLMEHASNEALPMLEGFEKLRTLGGKGSRAPNIEIFQKK